MVAVVLKTVCVKVGGTTDGGMAGRVSRVGAGRDVWDWHLECFFRHHLNEDKLSWVYSYDSSVLKFNSFLFTDFTQLLSFIFASLLLFPTSFCGLSIQCEGDSAANSICGDW